MEVMYDKISCAAMILVLSMAFGYLPLLLAKRQVTVFIGLTVYFFKHTFGPFTKRVYLAAYFKIFIETCKTVEALNALFSKVPLRIHGRW
jgi:hypothetical protein